MKRIFQTIFILLLFSLSVAAGNVLAQGWVRYPIPELGNCRDAKECYLFCQIPENKAACWSYGKYKLGPQVLGTTTMSEEEKRLMREKAKQYNVTFPIPELGNCTGPQECRDYCEQPTNQMACMEFAKKKGFAKEVERPDDGIPEEKRQEVMQNAQNELGCTSMESCRAICEQKRDKCEAFAKKNNLYKDPPAEYQKKKEELMRRAREDLGCDSMESCRNKCEKNPERCMSFAKKHGFDRGEDEPQRYEEYSEGGRGPSSRPPCASEESCKQYCKDHPNECPGYQGKPEATPAEGELRSTTTAPSAGFVGPTGCRTEAECKSFCESNPEKCPGFKDAHRPGPTPNQYQGGSTGKYPMPTDAQQYNVQPYNYQPQAAPSYGPQQYQGTTSTYQSTAPPPQPTP